MRVGIALVAVLWAQSALPYAALHRAVFPAVRDTTLRTWLPRLREAMEAQRRIEWNDRFFREVAGLYLQQSDSLLVLWGTLRRYVGLDSAALARFWLPFQDRTADPLSLAATLQASIAPFREDTTQLGYVLRQMHSLAQEALQAWLTVPDTPPIVPIVESALRGYLKVLAASYAFFGFDESPEPWTQKMQTIEAIGLLEYYAYGESANTYRAWKRGYLR